MNTNTFQKPRMSRITRIKASCVAVLVPSTESNDQAFDIPPKGGTSTTFASITVIRAWRNFQESPRITRMNANTKPENFASAKAVPARCRQAVGNSLLDSRQLA